LKGNVYEKRRRRHKRKKKVAWRGVYIEKEGSIVERIWRKKEQ